MGPTDVAPIERRLMIHKSNHSTLMDDDPDACLLKRAPVSHEVLRRFVPSLLIASPGQRVTRLKLTHVSNGRRPGNPMSRSATTPEVSAGFRFESEAR